MFYQAGQNRQAKVNLHFIVIGGSIAGLSTAYALRRAGHNVTIVERGNGKSRSQGGLRSPPNMTKALQDWGLGPSLRDISHRCALYRMQNGCNGDYIGCVAFTEAILDNFLADLVFLRHGDLHSMLYDSALTLGVKVMFDSEVVDVASSSMTVTLKGGRRLQADVVVVADGYNSSIRSTAMGEGECAVGNNKSLFVTFEVPINVIEQDEELSSLAEPSAWQIWFGDEHLVNGNVLGDDSNDFTVSIVQKSVALHLEDEDDWRPRTVAELGLENLDLEPRLAKLLKLARNVHGKVFVARPPVESLVFDEGNCVLVGEAGHPMPPISHHSVALAIEDAQTLGLLFSRIQRKDQISRLLSAYEEIRQPRIAMALTYEYHTQARIFAPRGEFMTLRDSIMRSALAYEDPGALDEETFKMVWGDELRLVNYDAVDKVEDWWNQYGSAFECKERVRRPTSVQVMVSRGEIYPNEIMV